MSSKRELLRKKLAKKKIPKICLAMIVRNESKNMPRLLKSIKPFIDMASIVDTGSTDDTIEVINNVSKELGIRTIVHKEPWKNFSYNRTHCVETAIKTFKDADYLILSDADFIWHESDNIKFDKSSLYLEQYQVKQKSDRLDYYNTRILSTKVDWQCCCFTHEYWAEKETQSKYQGVINVSKLESIWIEDMEDGGFKQDKYERDEKLLREQVAGNYPKSWIVRGKFYLANTLRDMKKFKEAIEWYFKRIEDGGFEEEVFHSMFQIGYCYECMGWELRNISLSNKDQDHRANYNKMMDCFMTAAKFYIKSNNLRKHRAEPLYFLCRLYRNIDMINDSVLYGIKALSTKYPDNDILFIDRKCYKEYPSFELFMCCISDMEKYKNIYPRVLMILKNEYHNLDDYMKNIVKNHI